MGGVNVIKYIHLMYETEEGKGLETAHNLEQITSLLSYA